MFKELLSQQNNLVRVKVDVNKFTTNTRDGSNDRENKTWHDNGVRSREERMRDKGSNTTGIVVNARGMNDGTKRGLLVEVVILKGSPLGFLKMTDVCASEL